MLRMRQVCLVAHDLDAVEADLSAIFGLAVCYRDPAVGRHGLHNFLMPIGNDFLEVVSPLRDGTAGGRYLDRRGGDGGYMVITQCDDIAAARRRVAGLGIRLVADLGEGEDQGIQLHPKDVPGAIVELRQNHGAAEPFPPWSPAGPDWQLARRTTHVRAMVAAEIQSADSAALANRWAAVLDRPLISTATGDPALRLDGATLRFVSAVDGRGDGLGGLDLEAVDRPAVLAAARQRGCLAGDDVIMVCGTRFRLVEPAQGVN